MNHMRQVLLGVVTALLSASIVLGSFSLALTEGLERVALLPSPVATETTQAFQSPVVPPTLAATQTETPSPTQAMHTAGVGSPTPALSPTFTPSATATLSATPPTDCPVPRGWLTLQVQPGDTLRSLAEKYNSTEDALMQANCLFIETLIPGTLLYVPDVNPTPIPTSASYDCPPPPRGWTIYTVKAGDTLYRLSRDLGVTVAQLQNANCLGSSSLIRNGQKLYVPFLPPTSAPPTSTLTQVEASPTIEPATPTVAPPTATLTAPPPSPVPTSTIPPTPSPAPTQAPPTPVPTFTPTVVPTDTPVATEEPGESVEP